MSSTARPDAATPDLEEPRETAPGPRRYQMGAAVRCDDGPCGYLGRLVVDPLSETVTHLIVEPRHRHARARLVPVAMIDADDAELRLRCSAVTFHALQHAQETDFLPVRDTPPTEYPYAGLGGALTMLPWPYYAPAHEVRTHERIPPGEVEIRRGEHLHATDGTIGKVDGLIVGHEGEHVTHVLLQEGHLWGTRQVTIPIDAVARIDGEGVHVSLSKTQVAALPGLELASPVAGVDRAP
jgi:hypothetical protein